jgi:hypothetical protein
MIAAVNEGLNETSLQLEKDSDPEKSDRWVTLHCFKQTENVHAKGDIYDVIFIILVLILFSEMFCKGILQ